MTRRAPPLWKTIATSLRHDIVQGRYPQGARLPTEAEHAQRFGVNRHTVRRALAALSEEGLVRSRRGAGVFVTQMETEYPIGPRVRFHQNIADLGLAPEKQVLSLASRAADSSEALALSIEPGDQVHVYEGVSLANDAPLALFRSVFSAVRFPNLCSYLKDEHSVTSALRKSGVQDYTRASTRIAAKLATQVHATHLGLRLGDPILRTTSINVDMAGAPIEAGKTWFAGDKVALVLDAEETR